MNYTRQQVNAIFYPVHCKTIISWEKQGYFQNAGHYADGRGKIRVYSVDNLYQIGIVAELSKLNCTDIAGVMSSHFSNAPDMNNYLLITGNDRRDYLVSRLVPLKYKNEIVAAVSCSTSVIVVNLPHVKTWVDASIKVNA